jgi:O-antigen/teichoic acid export membrane protein
MSKVASRLPILIGASWYFLEKAIRLIGAFLIGAWVARYLGPESYGALAYALALVAVLGFLGSLGIESLVVRDLVEAKRDQRCILSTYFFIRLAGSLLVPVLTAGYLMVTHADDRLLMLLATLCSSAIVFGAYDAADCWLQARHEARTTSVIRLVGFFCGALSRCLLIIGDCGVAWFAAVVVLESAVVAALYYRLLQRHGLAPSLRYVSVEEFKHLVLAGKMMVLSGLMNAVHSKIDVLVVGALLSKAAFGPYAIAVSMCAAWNMVGMSVVQAWAPRISKARVSGEDAYVGELRHLFQAMLGISVVGSAILAIFSPLIFDILLGPAYAAGSRIFALLIWSAVPVFVGIATSQVIVNERTYWVSVLRTLVGMASSLILIFPAITYYGTSGAAGVVIISACINASLILASRRSRRVIFSVLTNRPVPPVKP